MKPPMGGLAGAREGWTIMNLRVQELELIGYPKKIIGSGRFSPLYFWQALVLAIFSHIVLTGLRCTVIPFSYQ